MDEMLAETALAAPAFAYIDFGVAHGLSRDHLMAIARLTPAMRDDPDARIPILTFVLLWRELLGKLPDVVVPVELVRALDTSVVGVIGQIAIRADDVSHAAALVERFMRLADTAMRGSRIERGELVGLAIGHRPEVEAMGFPIELMIGFAFRLLQHAAHGALPLREVTFAHRAGYPVPAYEQLFGVPVRFGAAESALWLPRDAFALPIPDRDPVVRRYLEAHAESMLGALPASAPPVVTQVREAILVELATTGAELARVARRLAMSPRTLQRRLDELGTTYQQIVDDVRFALARELLADRARSIIDVAFELGYADLKSFYRAFRRWTDATPAEWRARHV